MFRGGEEGEVWGGTGAGGLTREVAVVATELAGSGMEIAATTLLGSAGDGAFASVDGWEGAGRLENKGERGYLGVVGLVRELSGM